MLEDDDWDPYYGPWRQGQVVPWQQGQAAYNYASGLTRHHPGRIVELRGLVRAPRVRWIDKDGELDGRGPVSHNNLEAIDETEAQRLATRLRPSDWPGFVVVHEESLQALSPTRGSRGPDTMPRVRYRVSHTTTYSYDEDVTNSFGIAHVTPKELPHQHIETTDVRISPTPADQSSDVDFYGNTVTYFQVLEPHQRLEIAAVSEVDVRTPIYDETSFDQPWERARPLVDPSLPGAWRAADLAVASPLVEHTPEAYDFGAVSLTEHRPLVEAAEDLMHRIHAGFDYDDTATTVTSTIPEIFEAQGGVCQDFAHLMLACFRAHGLAARYVSGYLATTPPPGRPRLVGADASHAWVEVWLPHLGADLSGAGTGQWLALDPTNDTRADDRYVSVAWGRDYADVPPVKGVIYTEATTSTLTVSVDVAPDLQE